MEFMTIVEEHINIPAGENRLEGVAAYPDQGRPHGALLLLTPHPHMGGNMDNNVMRHLARRFAEDGFATLRFNYRGVGNSTISLPPRVTLFDHWKKLEEEQKYAELLPDACAAMEALRDMAHYPDNEYVVGYSLGAILAIMLAGTEPFAGVTAIAPPNAKRPLPPLGDISSPWCVLGGDDDFVYDPDAMEATAEISGGALCRTVRLNGCDHFFRGQEERLYQTARDCMGISVRSAESV